MQHDSVAFFYAAYATVNQRYRKSILALLEAYEDASKAPGEGNKRLAQSIADLLDAVREHCHWQMPIPPHTPPCAQVNITLP